MAGERDGARSPRAEAIRRGPPREPVTIDLAADRIASLRSAADATTGAMAPPSSATAASGTRRGPRWPAVLLGAIIGSVIVFALGYALIATGTLPLPTRDETVATTADAERLTAEIEALRQTVAAIPAATDLTPIDQRLTAVEAVIGGLDTLRADLAALSNTAGANAVRLDDIGRELAALQEAITTTAAAGGDPDAANRIMEA